MNNTHIAFLAEPETNRPASEAQMNFVKKLFVEDKNSVAAVWERTNIFDDDQLMEITDEVGGKLTLRDTPERRAFLLAVNTEIRTRYVGILTNEQFQALDSSAASYLINFYKLNTEAALIEALEGAGFEKTTSYVAILGFESFDLSAPKNADLRALIVEIARQMFGTTPEPTPSDDAETETVTLTIEQKNELRDITVNSFSVGKSRAQLEQAIAAIQELRLAGYARSDSYEESVRLDVLARELGWKSEAIEAREGVFLMHSTVNRAKNHDVDGEPVYLTINQARAMLPANSRLQIVDRTSRGFGYSYFLGISGNSDDGYDGAFLGSVGVDVPGGWAEMFEKSALENVIRAYGEAVENMPDYSYSPEMELSVA